MSESRLWSLESEMALLGSCLLSEKVMPSLPWLKADMFYQPAHRTLFQAFKAIVGRGHAVDLVTVRSELGQRIAEVGGIEYVRQCAEAVPSAKNAAYYADSVRKDWIRRELIGRAESLVACANEGDVSELVGHASSMAQGLLPSTTYEFDGSDVAADLSDRIEPGLRSTFSRVNAFSGSGGFYKGEPNFIVAKRGGRKSIVLAQEARNACEQGLRVAIVSLEMDAKTLMRRIIRQMCTCSDRHYADRLGMANEYDEAVKAVSFWDLLIYDTSTADDGADEVEAVCEWVSAKHEQRPLDVLIVDYVQLLGTRKRHSGDTERNVIVARALKKLSKRCGFVPLFAAQLQEHEGARFIRHTKEYEDSAAYVLLMYQKDGEDVIECTKNRHGEFPWHTPVKFNPINLTVTEATEMAHTGRTA